MNLTHWTTKPQKVVPSAAAGVSVTPNAGAFVDSAWVQLTAGIGEDILIVGLAINPGAAAQYRIDLGTGGAGSEVVIVTGASENVTNLGLSFYEFRPPLWVRNGTRVAVRMRKAGTSVTAWTFKLVYYEFEVNFKGRLAGMPAFHDDRVRRLLRGSALFSRLPPESGGYLDRQYRAVQQDARYRLHRGSAIFSWLPQQDFGPLFNRQARTVRPRDHRQLLAGSARFIAPPIAIDAGHPIFLIGL